MISKKFSEKCDPSATYQIHIDKWKNISITNKQKRYEYVTVNEKLDII